MDGAIQPEKGQPEKGQLEKGQPRPDGTWQGERPDEPSEYRFGPFTVNLRAGELRKHGIRLKLAGKPFQILAALLERPAELITREELRARLWASNTHVEFDHSLDAAINKLRAALGDTAEAPRYVETVRGKGYRLLGTVTAGNGRGDESGIFPAAEKLEISREFPSLPVGARPAEVRRVPLPSAKIRFGIPGAAFSAASIAMLLVGAILEWAYSRPAPASAARQEMAEERRGLPTNPLAREYFLRGNDLSVRGNYDGATHLLAKSVALEPDNALAWAALATSSFNCATIQGGAQGSEARGWQAYQRAVALDPGNPTIVDVMAFHLMECGELDRAVIMLREDLRGNAQDAQARWFLSEAYRYGGMLGESIREGDLALQMNPAVSAGTLQNTYLYLGQYETFLQSLPAVQSARTSFYRGLAYCYLKDLPRAGAEFDHAFALDPALPHSQIGAALEFAFTGQPARGIEVLRRMESSGSHDGEMVYKMAQAYAQLGDKESSLRLWRRSIELNFYPYPYFLQDPLLDPIRTEPQYGAVLELARQRHESFRQRFF
jgi:DNA-binding winged helix-turn-helix (wHTH) protein/Flp pilus assembly protein TadD